jgi:3-hydroxyisobutyrate dehydrogenase-like beta-hydroxyacid dehydrogenase
VTADDRPPTTEHAGGRTPTSLSGDTEAIDDDTEHGGSSVVGGRSSVVGVIGIGAMGTPMARNLAKRAFELVVCDAVPERARVLEGPNVAVAATPREVAERARRVITILPSLEAIEQVVLGADGFISGAGEGSVLIEMSTSLPALSRRLAAELGSRGVRMLDVPVSGTTPAAEAGTLVGMVGGEADTLEDCRSVLEAVCGRLFHCGAIGQGNAMKLAINLLIYVPTLAAFEALALGAKAGLDPRTVLEVIGSGAADSYIVKYKLGKALKRDFVPGGSVDVAVKDLELAVELAREAGVPMLLPPIALQAFNYAKHAGLAQQDTAVLLTLYEKLLSLEIRG